MPSEYRSFLALSYDELEQLNLQAKADRLNRVAPDTIREQRIKCLAPCGTRSSCVQRVKTKALKKVP